MMEGMGEDGASNGLEGHDFLLFVTNMQDVLGH